MQAIRFGVHKGSADGLNVAPFQPPQAGCICANGGQVAAAPYPQVGLCANEGASGTITFSVDAPWSRETALNRRMMKSKIHRATVTNADLNYVGSITIDADLMAAADLLTGEQVAVVNINNGQRFETYVLAGDAGSGVLCLHGAAARLVAKGDLVIVISYADYDEDEIKVYQPAVVHVDAQNRQITESKAAHRRDNASG